MLRAILLLLLPLIIVAETDERRIVAEIISAIETPIDTHIAFSEKRRNRLLQEPLELEGYMLFTSEGALTKQVESPFRERVTISATEVEFERNSRIRRVPINQRPGIRVFYSGMQALIKGDPHGLFERFEVSATINEENWHITLVPHGEALGEFVAVMSISGNGAHVLTVRTEQPGGDWQEMFFGASEIQ